VPDGRSAGRWRALGRLLPREVRERVFEPAFADLLRAWLTSSRSGVPFPLRAVGTLLGCLPIAVPRLFVREGRLTRLGRASIVLVALLGVTVVVVSNLGLYDT
jgi:hypothetical protein